MRAAVPATNRKRCTGLTAVELVVVSAILSLLTGLVWGTLRYQSQTFSRQNALNATQKDMRTWLSRIVRDVRRAGYDPRSVNDPANATPTFGIREMTSSTLRLTADTDGDGVVASGPTENLGFRLNQGTLEIWQGGSSWRPVLRNVTQLQIVYRDVGGDVTSTRRDVRIVEVTVSAATETAGTPGLAAPVVSQTIRAELRNPVF